MLLNSSRRLSIDIDIIIEIKLNNLDQLLDNVAVQQGFIRKEEQYREAHTQIEKTHYKFFYTPLHQTRENEEFVLLDILFENAQYQNIGQHEIRSVFLPQSDPPLLVNIPSFEDITADKLTAFAPNTTGIPYWKGADSMSMEIIKQLYDLGNLFDHVTQIDVLKKTFEKIALTEIAYRPEKALSINDILVDIFQTSLCIASRGIIGKGNFNELQEGIRRITGYIFTESYHIEKSITHASKTAYLSILIKARSIEIHHFNSPNEMENWTIGASLHTKLNKLKKSNPEAFFYWYQIEQLL